MPVSPSPEFVTLRYKKVVGLGLAFQAINLAQGEFMGHRVRLSLPVDLMNEYFTWQRAVGEVRPTGRFTNAPAEADHTFAELLTWALGSPMTDVDGVANGLNYSSEALDTYNDSKRDTAIENVDASGTAIQDKHYSANDLVMAYVLFKCFGSSAFDAADIIYNLEDAFGMLSSAALAEAVKESLRAEDDLAVEDLSGEKIGNRGKVDEMFRALLAADPKRFMKNGKQIDGLFETNADVSGNADASGAGNWCLKVGDIIEVPIKLYFTAPVTVLSVTDEVRQPSSLTPANPETVVIKGEPGADEETAYDPNEEGAAVAARENTMSVRLQLLCSAPRGANSGATSEVGAATPAFKLITQMNLIFYNGPSYPAQSAIAVITSGGAATPTYTLDASGSPAVPVGVTISSSTGVLTFNRGDGAGIVSARHPVRVTATSGTEVVAADIFVSIDDGTGSSNTPA
jgi:hypothetical protein